MADEPEKKPDEAAAAGGDGGEKGKGKSSNMVFIIILAAVVVINGAMALLLIQITKPPKVADEEEIEAVADSDAGPVQAAENPAYSSEPIEAIVNIAGTDGARFLKVSVLFEYDMKKYKNLGADLDALKIKHKDLLIQELSRVPLEQLSDPRMRDKIREKLLNSVNKSLRGNDKDGAGLISAVYFNDFIIQ